ncbi:uncharacterized protein LOC120012466 [Tripterygium wilfordii]|uniref:uncharacterized protein LOC120012466 n=1 Tax=Tripterygium wilfordii TaxID=458696 RepID=UPI0018F80C35|nr:uncharacterized protein LOC120012466 [Tripterygium wilfordii]
MEVDGVITTEEQPVGVTMDLEQEQEQQEHEEDEVENEDEEGVEEGDGGGDNENDESLEIDKKRKRRRSAVWDEFDEVTGTNKMQCKHCKAQLQISGGTTSHFRRHLKGCARRMTNQKSQKISGFRSGKITREVVYRCSQEERGKWNALGWWMIGVIIPIWEKGGQQD